MSYNYILVSTDVVYPKMDSDSYYNLLPLWYMPAIGCNVSQTEMIL
jgi:hypothetical protein